MQYPCTVFEKHEVFLPKVKRYNQQAKSIWLAVLHYCFVNRLLSVAIRRSLPPNAKRAFGVDLAECQTRIQR